MGKLYVVGTPIGNLGDFSPRAVEILNSVDFIAAEDTRVTQKLLNRFEIKKPTISYFEHNRREKGEYILSRIENGENCALVTDAGMPAISDPGEDLVQDAHIRGISVESVPGPTAFATALAISGMPSGRFTFEGFVSQNKLSRKEHLEGLIDETRTMIFYEAPHKLMRTLEDFKNTFGTNRKIAVVKELTKIHENVFISSIGEAIEFFTQNDPKGEFVLIVQGKEKIEKQQMTLEDAVKLANDYMKEGIGSSEAAKRAAKVSKIKKSDIYSELQKSKF